VLMQKYLVMKFNWWHQKYKEILNLDHGISVKLFSFWGWMGKIYISTDLVLLCSSRWSSA
jgi:hypothetical protein